MSHSISLRRLIVNMIERRAGMILIPALLMALSGCAIDRLLSSSDPVEGTVLDPSAVKTRDGAIRVHRSAMLGITAAFAQVSYHTAVFTDEMTADLISSNSVKPIYLDSRQLTAEGLPGILADRVYDELHITRVNATQAISLLQRYGRPQDSVLIGEAYAVQAQAIVFLGELFCSGIPLTQVPLEGGLQYTRGMSTVELFETAVALFDTAIAYANDSVRVSSFAKIGKGRALINLGLYDQARNTVESVQTSYQYSLRFSTVVSGVPLWSMAPSQTVEVGDGEGGTGMDWITVPQDPRVAVAASSPYRQLKLVGTSLSLPVAKGISARMMEAEALLQPPSAPSGDWLAPINSARATIGLDALTDPGTANSRVDLLFRERAFWFFLEGHRLADLRRLVRQYNRLPMTVYPTGVYSRGTWQTPAYEANYVFSPPRNEEERNHLYTGCIDRNP